MNTEATDMDRKTSEKSYIYLIRHGHREDSASQKLLCNRPYPMDPDLSELGLTQAKELSQEIFQFKVDAIYSSPYLRTIHTAYWCGRQSDKEISIVSALSEYYYVKANGYPAIRSFELFKESFPKLSHRLLVQNEQEFNLPAYFETEDNARSRISHWFRKYFKRGKILVVTHESICNLFITELTKASNWIYTPLGFGSISILESTDNQQWKLVKLNDTSFLSSGEICR